MSPHNEHTVILSSLYLAPVEYYATLFHCKKAVIEVHDNHQKQSYRNRCVIAGANGPLTLTIPVEKPSTAKCKTKDIRISDHGSWRHLHWNAIISAYNSTPFFQYYEDEFRPFYEKKFEYLFDFNEQLRLLIFKLAGLNTPVAHSTDYKFEINSNTETDLREFFHPKKKIDYKTPEYYQVFYEKHGFIPNLSIIDLLFNLGNETRLYFNKLADFFIFV